MRNVLFFAVGSALLIATVGGFLLYGYLAPSETTLSDVASDPFAVRDPFGNVNTSAPRQTAITAREDEVVISKTTKDVFARVASSTTPLEGSDGTYYRLLPPNGTATSSPFVIIVSPGGNYIQITIYGTPVGRYRKEAERLLLNYFGISEDDACTIPYLVVPAYDTESEYAGTNVGLSFCPGSVKLSEI
ncbi:hypothetical protein K2X83_03020 [Patescibacteria group bacterium]|nr:hypothetical protein [Patescibacteria group bacterium]